MSIIDGDKLLLEGRIKVLERDLDIMRVAAQMALAYHCWREFGECRVDDKPLPMAHEVEKKLRDVLGVRP